MSFLLSFLFPEPAQCSSQPGFTPIEQFQQSADSSSSGISAPPPIDLSSGSPSTSGQPVSNLQRYPTQPLEQPPPPPLPGSNLPKDNPGTFDKADQDALRILKPDIYDGCRFEQNKPLGQFFSVSHALWLGSALLPPPGNNYSFGSTLVLNEGKTMITGRMANDLRLDAQWHQEIVQPERVVSKLIMSVGKEGEQAVTHGNLDFNGEDYNLSVKLAKGPMLALSYFQKVTKNLALGGEGFHHSGQGMTHIFLRGKYATAGISPQMFADGTQFNLTLSTMGAFGANVSRKINERVSLAADFEYSLDSGKSNANFGYEFMLRQSKISGVISTDGMIQSQLQEMIAPGLRIVFNSILDHSKDTHRFGYGVQIG